LFEQYKHKQDIALKGTTTVGVVCQDGVTLATDTRVTMGYFVAHKHGKKVYKIDEHLAMTIAGVVADAQNVVEILKANAALFKLNNRRPMPVATAARLTANILFNNRFLPLGLQAIIAGVDTEGASLYSLDPFGSITEEKKFYSTGSGSPIALGILENGYTEGVAVEGAVPLVVKAVKAAMKRDIASGESFDVVVITEKGYRELNEDEKSKYIEA
jgi:proteasome beta subunit